MSDMIAPNRPFIPSPQQLDYFSFIEKDHRSLVLEAVAGSGKTETLARSILLMKGSVEVIVFNKSAAIEFKERVKRVGADRKGVFVSTCHSVGFNIWRRVYPQVEVNEKKIANIIAGIAARGNQQIELIEDFIGKVVGLGKQMLAGVDWAVTNKAAWEKLITKFGCDQDLPEVVSLPDAIELVIQVFEASGKLCPKIVDFNDMIWAPIAYKCRFFTNDWVLIDEAQDTNPARRRLAKLLLRPNGRLVSVGDSRQAIYGFTGADADALDLIAVEFKCHRLPLSVTYRCPKSVVEHARQWVSHIVAHDTAPEGIVRRLQVTKAVDGKNLPWIKVEPFLPTDAILCRYNAPLVKTAYQLLAEGIACKVEGRDIGKGLMAMVRKWKVKSIDALEGKLDNWLDKEIAKAKAIKSDTREQAAIDKVDCLKVFMTRCRDRKEYSVLCLEKEIDALFADDVSGVLTLASGHKSKGREWKRVWWVQQAQRGRKELTDEEQTAEDNIRYVICTRAQEELILVGESIQ